MAAGPRRDQDGAGRTVLTRPGGMPLDEAGRLATEDDPSVAQRLLRVTVRPWHDLRRPRPAGA